MPETSLPRDNAARPHWIVRTHYIMRSLAFLVSMVFLITHEYGHQMSPAFWALAVLQFLVYPHVVYRLALRSDQPLQAEFVNLVIDSLAFGAWTAALGYPIWITFALFVSSVLNNAISRGIRGIVYSTLSYVGGALAVSLVFGWSFMPETNLPTTLLCALGMGAYLLTVGALSYQRNRRLHDIRLRLQEGEQALNDANQTLQQQLTEIHSLQERLSEQALRDPLTNLHNRRFLDTTLERELARCKRDGQPLCLILIDIDHFKQINDTYGHQAGDEVIKSLASLLTEQARVSDVACRYGGEEFLMLLPNIPSSIAYTRAEHWRQTFSEHVTRVGDARIRSTLSIGVANFPENGDSSADLFRCADLAMYKAKTAGRNRVVIYDPN